MAIAFTETHDCHQVNGVCRFACCPLGPLDPVDVCPKTHKATEMVAGRLLYKG